jgi:hypothetical protein
VVHSRVFHALRMPSWDTRSSKLEQVEQNF